MTEEVIETPTQDEPEAAPETGITDEQVAQYLGIPVEEVDKAKNVAELYKRANNYNREAKALFDKAQAQAQAPAQMTPTAESDDSDPFSAFDADTAKALRAAVAAEADKRIGPLLYAQQQRQYEEMQSVIDSFHDAHASEPTYSYDKVVETINELGFAPLMNSATTTPAQVKKILNTAYKVLQTENTDVEKKAEELAVKMIADAKEKGEKVESIKPKRTLPKEAEADLLDPNLTPEQRYALVKRMQAQG